jgi:hypothetical protein
MIIYIHCPKIAEYGVIKEFINNHASMSPASLIQLAVTLYVYGSKTGTFVGDTGGSYADTGITKTLIINKSNTMIFTHFILNYQTYMLLIHFLNI